MFSFIRDYETVKIEEDIGNEFVLVIDEGEEEGPQGRREKAAYYKGVERKIVLKKKRANVRYYLSLFFVRKIDLIFRCSLGTHTRTNGTQSTLH